MQVTFAHSAILGDLLILVGALVKNDEQVAVQHVLLGVLLSHGMPHLKQLQQTMLPLADVPNEREGSDLTNKIKVHKS